MKYIASMALLAMAQLDTVSAGGRCSLTLTTYDPGDSGACTTAGTGDDSAFTVENWKIGKCEPSTDNDGGDDDAWIYIPYCDEKVGAALYMYADENCETFSDVMSPDWGCPKDACCHFSGSSMDFFSTGYAVGIPYKLTIDGQRGSETGLGLFGAIGQIFKALVGF